MSDITTLETLRPGDKIAQGKYLLYDSLGEGGMGAVWRAQQTGTAGFAKPVALKLMLAQEDQQAARKLFLDEARISARLHNPNIIEVYDLGQDGDIDYIAMEYIAGLDLRSLLMQTEKAQSAIPWHVAAYIVAEAAKGLHYAHDRKDEDGTHLGLIHRDIKPANILLSYEGYVKVIDFGIAKSAINDSKTKTGMVKGTPAYMSPEQLAAKILDRRADLFSLGAVLYELCTGQAAFPGETLYNIIFAIQGQPPRPFPQELSLPTKLEQIILRCLEKDREQRYASARELRFDLEELLSVESKRMDQESLADYLEPFNDKKATKGFLPTLSSSLGTAPPKLSHTPQATPAQLATGEAHMTTGTNHPSAQLSMSSEEDDYFEDDEGTFIDSSPAIDIGVLPTQMVDPSQYALREQAPQQSRRLAPYAIMGTVLLVAIIGLGAWLSYEPKQPPGLTQSGKAPTRSRPNTPKRSRHLLSKTPVRQPLRRLPTPQLRTAPRARKRIGTKRANYRGKRRVAKAKPKLKRVVSYGKATMMLDIQPRCRLFEGSKELGVADGKQIKVNAGNHRIRCIDFASRFVRIFRINLRPGQIWKQRKRYRRGTLFVLSFPASLIFLSARGQRFGLLGQSHEKIKLYEGTYDLTLHKKGSPTHKRRLRLRVKANRLTRPKVIW